MDEFDEKRRDEGGQAQPGEPDELSASEQAPADEADDAEAGDEIELIPLDEALDEAEADDNDAWADQPNDTTSDFADESVISAELTHTDVYVDPDTGEEETDPLLKENETFVDEVADLLDGTNLEVSSVRDGVVALTGAMATREDLEEVIREIMGLDEVLEVDITDVDVG